MVTSRDLPEVRNLFLGDKYITMKADDEDMKAYVRSYFTPTSRLSKLAKGKPDLLKNIEEEVVRKAAGM